MNNFREDSNMRKKSILNILVVDDEEEIGDIFTKWLSLEGHKGQYVLTGKRAIDLAKRQYLDFVFLDIVMPGISAIEVLDRIRDISPKTKVIVITGRLADKRLIEEMRERGAAGFLQKPFRLKSITRVLKEMK
jgi:DNA-binding NtrC family response regulator